MNNAVQRALQYRELYSIDHRIVRDDGSERTPAPARDDSPYDYQSSEEISEDLSVSFPVDI